MSPTHTTYNTKCNNGRCLEPVPLLSRADHILGAHTPIHQSLCEWRLLWGRARRTGNMSLICPFSASHPSGVRMSALGLRRSVCISVSPKWNICGHILEDGKSAGICLHWGLIRPLALAPGKPPRPVLEAPLV